MIQPDNMAGRICTHYVRGRCRFGDQCRFQHLTLEEEALFVWKGRETLRSQANLNRHAELEFKVLSYNLLAEEAAANHAAELYRSVPSDYVMWRYRRPLIVSELLKLSADIICLQEVDHYKDILAGLKAHGYEGVYAQRTGGRADGCATFWRSTKFSLVGCKVLNMSSLGLRDNVALFTILRPATQQGHLSCTLLVGNTHIIFNPKRGDIKLGQVRSILEQLRVLQAQQEAHGVCHVVLCGDFNSVPGSGIHRYLRDGMVDCSQEDRREMSGQVEGQGCGWEHWKWKNRQLLSPDSSSASPGESQGRWNTCNSPSKKQRFPDTHRADGTHVLASHMVGPQTYQPQNHQTTPNSTAHQVPPWHGGYPPPVVHFLEEIANGEGTPGNTCTPPSPSAPPVQSPYQRLYPRMFASPVVSPYHRVYPGMSCSSSAPVLDTHTPSFHHTWSMDDLQRAVGDGLVDGDDVSEWVVRHSLPLASAYAHVTGREPEYTTCHSKFIGCVDYVWFSSEADGDWEIHPVSVLMPPELSSLTVGLPSKHYPSDHICLLVDFALTYTGQ